MRTRGEREPYSAPEIKTIGAAELLRALGPAQGMSSGFLGSPGGSGAISPSTGAPSATPRSYGR